MYRAHTNTIVLGFHDYVMLFAPTRGRVYIVQGAAAGARALNVYGVSPLSRDGYDESILPVFGIMSFIITGPRAYSCEE